MATLYVWSTGDLITATRLNTVPNGLNGASGAEVSITLANNAAGTLLIQPNSVPSPTFSTQLVQVNNQAATNVFAIRADGGTIITQDVNTTGSPNAFVVTGGAHTTLTASVEVNDVWFDLDRTVQFATGALTTQRAVLIEAPTYAFAGASTINTAATFAVSGPPIAGANATLTSAWTIWSQSGTVRMDAGTLTVSVPVLDSSATWNSGGTTFTHIKANITNTASAAASNLIDLQVGGVSKFNVAVNGTITNAGNVSIGNAITFAKASPVIAGGSVDLTFVDNTSTFANLRITDAGVVTIRSTLTATQITATLGLASTGAVVNLNASSNFNVNIATGSSTGAVAIGNAAAGAVAIASGAASSFTVTGANILLTTLSSGNITLSAAGNVRLTAPSGGVVIVGLGLDTIAFFNGSGATKQTVSGSRGSNAALASLLTALAGYGLIVDSSS